MRNSSSIVLLSIFLSAIVLGVGLGITSTDSRPSGEEATYVGWQTCVEAGCHVDYEDNVYEGEAEFRKTMHANIHNRPTPENVIIDEWFERDTTLYVIETKGQDSVGNTLFIDLSKQGTKDRYFMQLRTNGTYADSTGWLSIVYNYGGNGWLQRFLVELDGRYYPVPFQYVLNSYGDTETISGKVAFVDQYRWYYFETVKNAIFFHERGSDTLLELSWDHDCAACHVNGFDLDHIRLNDSVDDWKARWVGSDGTDSAIRDINIAVGCESCHGPGSLHVADTANRAYQEQLNPALWDTRDTSRYWTDRKLDLCNQCHNRHRSTENIHRYQYDDANELPYLPRLELNDFIRHPTADGSYWNDRVTSLAHHQQGQDYWRSGHYREHVFPGGCFDCHKPHRNTEYPYQLDRNWYSLKKGDGCVAFGCHAGYANTELRNGQEFNLHAQHLNRHSQCVNCHYTKTASISFAGIYEFSDHSDKVIRPTATLLYRSGGPNYAGALNTCAVACHRNGYGERNRPDAFDRNASIRYSMGDTVVPMRAPDYGIHDGFLDKWNNPADIALAESLWVGYQEMYGIIESVKEGESVATVSGLSSLSPNPASESVRIRFDLRQRERVRLEVYDRQGRAVRIISEGVLEPGSYRDEWELVDEFHRDVPQGTYFIRLAGESFTSSRAVVVQR